MERRVPARHVRRRQLVFGKTARLDFMHPIGRVMLWVAAAAWTLAAAAFFTRLACHFRPPAADTGAT